MGSILVDWWPHKEGYHVASIFFLGSPLALCSPVLEHVAW